MNVHHDFKYDVAISFLQEDEALARELNNLLSESLDTFVYFDHQDELAGTDGEITFNRVFGQEARIVVVLHRTKWGTTPWTRIEETAIRNRAYDHGYDFVIMIPLDDKPSIPKWLPKTNIFVGLNRWGLKGAAAVIESRVKEAGGAPKDESLLEQASRISRQKADEEQRLALLSADVCVNKAKEELNAFFTAIEKSTEEINQAGGEIKFTVKRVDKQAINLHSWGYHLYIRWTNSFVNTLRDSVLEVLTYKDPPFAGFGSEKPVTISSSKFDFDVRLPAQYGWTTKNHEKRFYISEQLAAHCVKILLELLQAKKPWLS